MKTKASSIFTRPRMELVVFCLAVLVVPMLLGRITPETYPFDPAPGELLKAERPAYVFIGNSMVESRIHEATLEELTGENVSLLASGGSTSARWYLFLKNYLIARGVKPRRVFIFFRDRALSLPHHRLTGEYREENERAMTSDDTVVRGFMRLADRYEASGPLPELLERLYPIQRRGVAIRESITEELVDGLSRGKRDEDEVTDDLEDTFAIKNLRDDLQSDLGASVEEEEVAFSSRREDSFLPHIIKLAKDADIPIVFVRVKRRPEPDGTVEQSEALTGYIRDLRAYFESEGVPFHDESSEPVSPEWYGDGDHIAEERKPEYTRHFYHWLRPWFR